MSESQSQLKWMKVGGAENVLYFPNNEMVVPAMIDRRTYSVVRINDKGAEKWKHDLKEKGRKETIVGIGKFKGNILVLIANDVSNNYSYGMITRIEGLLLDGAKGTVLQEKTLILLEGKNYVEARMIKDKNGEVQHVMIRHTRWDGEEGFASRRISRERAQSKKIELYDISPELTATVAHEYGINEDVFFYGMGSLPTGDLLVLWLNKTGELVMEQFKGDGVEARVVLPLDWDKESDFSVNMRMNPDKPTHVVCGINHTNRGKRIATMLVDLETKTVKTHEEKITKDYRRELEATAVAFNAKRLVIQNELYKDMIVTDIEFYQDKTIVVKEIGAPTSRSYMNGDAIITVFDKDMKVLKHFFINKTYPDPVGKSVSLKVSGDKLQLLTVDMYGLATVSLLYGEINLKTLEWIKLAKVKEGKKEVFGTPFRIWETIWLPNNMLVNQADPPGLKFIKGELKPVTYDN
ncbi:MAG TPA: hypothetical protein VD993_07365 [Chitinophagaceae bacterium]|nr:hypothetical protein [Chitinophagaceae bacterium]